MTMAILAAIWLAGVTSAPQAAARPATVIASPSPQLAFRYAWPAEAAAIPRLDRQFRLDAARTRRAALTAAVADQRSATANGFPFRRHELRREWTLAGQSPGLLSLRGSIETYTGGAHGNQATLPLLWDRRRGRDIGISTLLRAGQSWDGAIHRPFCILLDRERAKRRGGPVTAGGFFSDCPKLGELRLVLADSDGDQRFDHLLVIADPYVAGSYAEGRYVIPLPVTAAMAARLKPEYRAEFRPQPAVQ